MKNGVSSVFTLKKEIVRGGNIACPDRAGVGDFALCITLSRQCSMINDQCSGTDDNLIFFSFSVLGQFRVGGVTPTPEQQCLTTLSWAARESPLSLSGCFVAAGIGWCSLAWAGLARAGLGWIHEL